MNVLVTWALTNTNYVLFTKLVVALGIELRKQARPEIFMSLVVPAEPPVVPPALRADLD